MSRVHIFIGIAIIVLIAGWLGLVERRMSAANTVGKLTQENKELESEVTSLTAEYLSAVSRENRALISSGALLAEEAPSFAYRNGSAGVALAPRGR